MGLMPGGLRLPLTPLTAAGEAPVLSAMRRAGIMPA
jgi:4-hydroxy-tetrahydrodipicolinate synthase